MFQDFDQQNNNQIPAQKVFDDFNNQNNTNEPQEQFSLEEESIHSMPDKFIIPGEANKKNKNWVLTTVIILMIIVVLGIAAFGVYVFVIKKPEESPILNLEPSENPTTTPENNPTEDLSTALNRDKRRLEDISKLRSALSLYFSDSKKYPNRLDELNKYFKEIPRDPGPGGEYYNYETNSENSKYKLIFNLEEGGSIDGLTLPYSGKYQATSEIIEIYTEEPIVIEPPVSTTTPPAVIPQRPPKGEDLDGDGLTNKEEALFDTDRNKVDTDSDGFADKEELITLYDPTKANGKLVNNASIAKVYRNEGQGYSIIYPGKWRYNEKNSDSSIVIFQEFQDADFFQIEVQENLQSTPLRTWYANMSPDSNPNDLENFSNKNNVFGLKSPDGFSVYISKGSKIFIISYIVVNEDSLEYFSAFEAFLQAFQLIAN